MVKCEP